MTQSAPAKKVLFVGSFACPYSKKAFAHLEELNFDVTAILSKSRKDPIPSQAFEWQGDYIISFRSYFIVPKAILEKASIAAINFHPAPPQYPGSGCVNWALYDNANEYGVTAHIMNEKIDNGAIIECRRFPIEPQDHVESLLNKSMDQLLNLFIDTTNGIAGDGKQFISAKLAASKHEQWAGKARKISAIDQLQIIDPNCTKEELERIIRATYIPAYPPEIRLHGYRFILKK